ncbi:unnamed protein product [Closterium sp. Naga37s-1]|nr:unnamed protein product [Closterium sp. Naga37s-1]
MPPPHALPSPLRVLILLSAPPWQDAATQYRLSSLRLEFFLNTCDHPMSFPFSLPSPMPPVQSTFSAGRNTIDIPVPDPLDLTGPYTPDLSTQILWEKKEARAVFRGKTTNYELLPAGNWGANPRIRLHLMSPAAPHLMDARINAWSKAEQRVIKRMVKDGVRLARKMNFQQFNTFKYQIVADGGGGSCRTCGVLRSNQLIIRQHTPMLQFYEPLLQDRVHWLATSRTFSDLHEAIIWAQQHDKAVLRMVEAGRSTHSPPSLLFLLCKRFAPV